MGAGVGSRWVVRVGARWVLGCDRGGFWGVPMHWGGCRGGYRIGYRGGQGEMPALRADTGADSGGWVPGCRRPEVPVRRVGAGIGTEVGTELGNALGTGVLRGLPMRRGG